MILIPKVVGTICITAHPDGCKKALEEDIHSVQSMGYFSSPQKVLVIGASTGYGLSSRIVSTYGMGSATIGVFLEKAGTEKHTATPGWYNSAVFDALASKSGYYAKSINGDAFSDHTKARTADLIRQDLKSVDLLIYSLAAPRRTDPETGQVYTSFLKPRGSVFTTKTINPFLPAFREISIAPATDAETESTVRVMGGEDWAMWIAFLEKEGLFSKGAKTVAFSYEGGGVIHPIYRDGTIGAAKAHLKKTAEEINRKKYASKVSATVSYNPIVVTQASAAIPSVPLYVALLYKILKSKNSHYGCIDPVYHLFSEHLCFPEGFGVTNADGCIHVDNLELRTDIQTELETMWADVTESNYRELCDLEGYCREFYRLYGFGLEGIDYSKEVNPVVEGGSIIE